MRPIIEYHGPLFQLLHQAVKRLGYDQALLLWRLGAITWLVVIGWLAGSRGLARVFTVLLLLGVVLLRVPGLGLVEQNVDESQWIVSAATLVHDPRFWQSVDGTTSGPLNVWPLMLIYYLGAGLDYTTLRGWGLLTCVLPTVWLLLATFRRQFGERPARLAIVPVASCLALTTDPDAIAFNSEQLPMTLLALAGYLLSRLFTSPESKQNSRWAGWMMLGVILGCLPYTKLQASPIGLVIATWVLAGLLADSTKLVAGRWARVGGFVAGGLLPTAGIGLYLLTTGLTDYAFRSYILTNLAYAQSGSWGAGTIDWTDRLLVRLPHIYGNMRTTNWFWRLALCLGATGIIAWIVRPVPPGRIRAIDWFPVSICLVSLYAVLQPGNPFFHYQWLTFVPVSWLIGQLLHRLLTDPLRRRESRIVTIGYLLISLVFPGWLALMTRSGKEIDQLVSGNRHSSTWPVAEAIRPYARPNQTMVIWGWANSLHVETGLLLGSRFIPLYFPVVPGPEQVYFLDVYRQDLLTNRPTVIVDAVDMHVIGDYQAYPIRRYPAIQAILATRYQLVQALDGAKIYVLRH